MNKLLFTSIDNSPLIVFRVFFGFLCFLESVGAVVTGWVKRTLIDPEFTFTFIGFEWLQPLPGDWMYAYYIVMGLFGLMIMIGYKYRFSAFMFAIMWTATYLMQKSAYNNHYYLLCLLSFIMVALPANRYASIDVLINPKLKKLSMPSWCRWVFIIQLFIIYTYASIAKIYPDWLNGSVTELLMKARADYPIIGDLLQEKAIHYCIAYGGILFDGLIIPLLLYKPTRKVAFIVSIFFHLFNSVVFQIGIFPYLSLAFSVFFFEPKTIQSIFLRSKPLYTHSTINRPQNASIITVALGLYFLIQLALPLRHNFIEDDVLWTEEGHRLSWRMMLRTRSGTTSFKVIDKANNAVIPIDLNQYLTAKQKHNVTTKPDFMWQFAQFLKKEFATKNKDVEIYVTAYVGINGRPLRPFVDASVDLAVEPWRLFKHSRWLLPSK
ncbi:MAG: HTTM domain-containing protein [Winogradskyella sp.]|nr:HTTM domain-containing protein [Winogradskyella sp.]